MRKIYKTHGGRRIEGGDGRWGYRALEDTWLIPIQAGNAHVHHLEHRGEHHSDYDSSTACPVDTSSGMPHHPAPKD